VSSSFTGREPRADKGRSLCKKRVMLPVITSAEARVAKNYLEELELKRLELLVEQFLSFAELRSIEKAPMYMSDWVRKLDEFLILNEKKILTNAGAISREDMEEKVRAELGKYYLLTV
jgi:hypothetical protein